MPSQLTFKWFVKLNAFLHNGRVEEDHFSLLGSRIPSLYCCVYYSLWVEMALVGEASFACWSHDWPSQCVSRECCVARQGLATERMPARKGPTQQFLSLSFCV